MLGGGGEEEASKPFTSQDEGACGGRDPRHVQVVLDRHGDARERARARSPPGPELSKRLVDQGGLCLHEIDRRERGSIRHRRQCASGGMPPFLASTAPTHPRSLLGHLEVGVEMGLGRPEAREAGVDGVGCSQLSAFGARHGAGGAQERGF